MIKIVKESFDLENEYKNISSNKNGAYSFFLGTVRSDLSFSNTEIKERFPYMNTDDLEGGSLGTKHEGTLDAFSLMQGFKLRARHNGVDYLNARVISLNVDKNKNLPVRSTVEITTEKIHIEKKSQLDLLHQVFAG